MRKVFISVLTLVLWAYVIQAQAPQTQATRTTTAAPTYTTGTYNPLSTDTSGNLRTAISATVTIGTSGLATSSNQTTLNTQTTKINDGTDTALISAAGALLTDASATTQPVSGTVAVSGVTGTVTVDTSNLATSTLQTTGNTSLSTIAGAVSGTEMQVDVLTIPSVTIGTFPDNEPFNVAQINGVTPLMGNGVTGTGSQRVTIASDNTAFTVNVGTFPDNEPFNLAQVNGTTTDDGNGAVGTGTLRIVQGSGSTVSSCADETQVTSVVISTATSGNVELVAISGSTTIYVCGYSVVATGAVAVQFIYGTGTACGTGETNLTGAMPFAANGGIAMSNGGGMQFKTAASQALCIELSAAVQIDGHVTYVQR